MQNERRPGYLDGGGNTVTGNSRNQVYVFNNYDAGGIAVQSVALGGGNTIGAYSVAGLPVQFFSGPSPRPITRESKNGRPREDEKVRRSTACTALSTSWRW